MKLKRKVEVFNVVLYDLQRCHKARRNLTMKTMQKIIGILLGLIMTTAALAGQPSYKLRVDGLACPFCAYGIEKKLGALEGVVAYHIILSNTPSFFSQSFV